jgi:hypothetical protein
MIFAASSFLPKPPSLVASQGQMDVGIGHQIWIPLFNGLKTRGFLQTGQVNRVDSVAPMRLSSDESYFMLVTVQYAK